MIDGKKNGKTNGKEKKTTLNNDKNKKNGDKYY